MLFRSGISCYNKLKKIQNYVNGNDEIFEEINGTIIEPNNYINKLPKNEDTKMVIDWGHHTIRYAVMFYNLMFNIIGNDVLENKEQKDQFVAILRNISNKSITHYKYIDYNKKLRFISKNIKEEKRNNNTEIPLLLFDTNENTKYHKYTEDLKNIMNNIQLKIIKNIEIHKLPLFCPLECVILLFMIKIMDDGFYSDISIMDIYSIMYCYDSCSDTIDENHTEINKCICRDCFTDKNNNSSYDEIRKSIKNHYDNVEYIKKIYYNYKRFITENTEIKNMKYNVQHKLWFGENNDNFKINNEYPIIGHCKTHVIYFIIKPQFNELNFNNIMCEILLHNFMILNCGKDTENYKRYNNKKIYTCIVTFDSIEPIFYELNIDKNDILMKQCVKNYLFTKYTEHHELIYKFYKHCYKNKPKNKNSVSYTREKLSNKYHKLPQYILDFFYDISKELEICGNDKTKINNVLVKINDKEIFINNINVYLEKNIDSFLEMNEDEFIDF